MTTTLIDQFLREVESTLRADPERKRQILDELRTHLHDKVADERAAHPERSEVDVHRAVLAGFGNPRDLALAYEPEGWWVLRNTAGDIVLRAGGAIGRGARIVATDVGPRAARAVGRGTGRVLKWVAIASSVLLVLAIGVGVWAFYEVRPVVAAIADQAMPAYEYHESCLGTPCHGVLPQDRFYVPPEAKHVRISVDVDPPHLDRENASGVVRVILRDPTGEPTLNRTFTLGDGNEQSQDVRLAAVTGNWTVEYEFSDFRGSLDVETYAYNLRWEG